MGRGWTILKTLKLLEINDIEIRKLRYLGFFDYVRISPSEMLGYMENWTAAVRFVNSVYMPSSPITITIPGKALSVIEEGAEIYKTTRRALIRCGSASYKIVSLKGDNRYGDMEDRLVSEIAEANAADIYHGILNAVHVSNLISLKVSEDSVSIQAVDAFAAVSTTLQAKTYGQCAAMRFGREVIRKILPFLDDNAACRILTVGNSRLIFRLPQCDIAIVESTDASPAYPHDQTPFAAVEVDMQAAVKLYDLFRVLAVCGIYAELTFLGGLVRGRINGGGVLCDAMAALDMDLPAYTAGLRTEHMLYALKRCMRYNEALEMEFYANALKIRNSHCEFRITTVL